MYSANANKSNCTMCKDNLTKQCNYVVFNDTV